MMIRHQAISASAGSGKTFQLAHRYLRLLASGVPPERIIALTFSRKAAGEIFDSIVEHLSGAASSEGYARRTAALIEHPGLGMADFLGLLRALLESLHRLHIGTLDSFTMGIVRAFPMELGISMDLEIMDNEGDAARHAREMVLARIFNPYHHVDEKSRSAFREAFKQATFGKEEKSLGRTLEAFLSAYQNRFHALPEEAAWGHEERIWPNGCDWLAEKVRAEQVAEEMQGLLEKRALHEKIVRRWQAFIDAASAHGPGSVWTNDLEYLLKKLLPRLEALREGVLELKLDHKVHELTPRECELALGLVAHVMQVELRTCLERTRGMFRLLSEYEKFYEEGVRRRGHLTFDDAQYLLTEGNRHSGGLVPSCEEGNAARLYIDYRLDSRLDHWLLDEFQDTSDLQWQVLSNLADEVLQDRGGERSFFYVGDVKQAIYGWRGGNARLFGAILERYGDAIERLPLSTSFRSCQPVIDTVNRVFGNLPKEHLRPDVVRQWEEDWEEHKTSGEAGGKAGYTALLEPTHHGERSPSEEEEKFDAVAALLQELRPLDKGLSVAVLVRKNETGEEIVDALRSACPDMPVVHEGRAAIKDNPVVAVLLALVQFAAHPGDLLAWRHLEMSPLGQVLKKRKANRHTLPLQLLAQIQRDGLESFIRRWGDQLDAVHPLDAFGRNRLRQFVDAAGEFDQRGDHDGNRFQRFIDSYELHDLGSSDAIRVMTVHQSKGLGFDVVILPDLQSRGMGGSGVVDFVTARDPMTNDPSWALKMPRKMVAENDNVLAQHVALAEDHALFESLCVLYVAMTRAKRGLYLVSSYPGRTSRSFTPASLLKLQLTGDANPPDGARVEIQGRELIRHHESGDRSWYDEVPVVTSEQPEPVEPKEAAEVAYGRRKRLVRVSPSLRAQEEEDAATLFKASLNESFALGTAVHELFEQIEWLDDADVDELVEGWGKASGLDDAIREAAVKQFRQALGSEAVRQVLHRPPGPADVWREKPFEVVLGQEWLSGILDRVTLYKDKAGNLIRATILDFKSNEVATDEQVRQAGEHYRPQLELYRQALARITNLDEGAIDTQLLFTRPAKLYEFS